MRELHRVNELPLFQNRTYESEVAACDYPRGDVILVQDEANETLQSRGATSLRQSAGRITRSRTGPAHAGRVDLRDEFEVLDEILALGGSHYNFIEVAR